MSPPSPADTPASDVVIVGMATRLAGVASLDALWATLRDRRDVSQPIPVDRVLPGLVEDELGIPPMGQLRAALLQEFDADWRALRIPPLQLERMHRMERTALAVMAEALLDAGIAADDGPHPDARIVLASTGLGVDLLTDSRRRIRRFDLARPVQAALRARVPGTCDDALEVVDGLFNLAAPPVDADSLMTSAAMAGGRIANLFDIRGGHFAVDAGRMSSAAALEEATRLLSTTDAPFVLVCAHSPMLSPSTVASAVARHQLAASSPSAFGDTGAMLGEGAVALVVARSDRWQRRRPYAALRALRWQDDSVEQVARSCLQDSRGSAASVAAVVTTAAGRQGEAAQKQGLDAAYNLADDEKVLTSTGVRFGDLGPAAGLLAVAVAVLSVERQEALSTKPQLADNAPAHATRLNDDALVMVSDVDDGHVAQFALARPASPQEPSSPTTTMPSMSLAIVACGVVAPGASSTEEYWSNIVGGASTIGDLPASRWDVDALLEEGSDVGPLLRTRLAGVVDDDGLLPATPERPEPSWTLAKRAAQEAFAALPPHRQDALRGDVVDVVLGQLPYRWAEAEHERRLLFRGHLQLVREALTDLEYADDVIDDIARQAEQQFASTSVERWVQADVLSSSSSTCDEVGRHLQLGAGRRLSVDAACASSLVALDVAARRLQQRACSAALVGGVAFNLLPEYYISLSLLGALSPEGAPPFDVGADGFVPAEGSGVVLVRRLEDAIADGDPILAVVEGIGISSDGAGRSVFAPNPAGEEAAVQRALRRAGVSPADIDYVEAHGTGTKLGDATELATYAHIFGHREVARPLEVGTVKSQIGHQSSAAGAAGLIKVAIALSRKQLPPSNADTQVGPDWNDVPGARHLQFSTVVRHWTQPANSQRRAGVSAFGLGGINAHVVVTDAPRPAPDDVQVDDVARPQPGRAPPRGPRADRLSVELTSAPLPASNVALVGANVAVVCRTFDDVVKAVATELTRRGARPTTIDVEGRAFAQVEAALASVDGLDAIVDLQPLQALQQTSPSTTGDVDGVINGLWRSMGVARAALARLEGGARWLTATRLGGDLGLFGAGTPDRAQTWAGGVALGLAKGLRQEFGGFAKGVDFSPSTSNAALAARVVDELAVDDDRMEVGYLDRRLVPVFRRRMFPDAPVSRAAPGVVVFTGGGRGVTFECALALAQQGTPVVVTGRRPCPPADDVVQLDDDAFERWAQDAFAAARNTNPTLTPVRFAADVVQPRRSGRELWRNMQRVHAVGAPLRYEVCDINDAAALQQVVDSAVAEHGALSAVVHGAMVEHSTSLSRKTRDVVDATVRTKLQGGLNLLDAAAPHAPEAVVFFGSGAGRFGNRGQSDYCAANNAMAVLLQQEARRRFSMSRAICIDWTAWSDVGAAARDKDLADRVRDTGVTSVSPTEGVYWFLSELACGDTGERLVCEERLLDTWGGLGLPPTADVSPRVDDVGVPLRPGRWPFVQRVLRWSDDAVVAERTFRPSVDLVLSQHTLHGAPILPMAFGVEVVAEAASFVRKPGEQLLSVDDFEVHTPTKVHRQKPLLLELHADRIDGGVDVHTTSTLLLQGKVLDANRLHHRAQVRWQDNASDEVERRPLPEVQGRRFARSFFHLAKDPIGLGPAFSRASWITVGDDDVTGLIRAPRMRDMLSFTSCPRFWFDPFVLDASWQIASCWDGYTHGYVCVPMRVARVRRGRRRRLQEEATAYAKVRSIVDDDVTYDVWVVGDDDELLLETTGMVLRRIARQRPDDGQ